MLELARALTGPDAPAKLGKAELRAAVNALDDFLDANGAAIKAAIPLPARARLTNGEIALMVAWLALKRYGGPINLGKATRRS